MRNCARPGCDGKVGLWITESDLCTPCVIRGVPEPYRKAHEDEDDAPLSTFGEKELDFNDE